MNCCDHLGSFDHGPEPYIANVEQMAIRNRNFRTAIWTGEHLQMTLMSIPIRGDIGWEVHDDTDQVIRVEQGNAVVKMGSCQCQADVQQPLSREDAVFVPAGTWHNVINTGRVPLKISSIYAPANHPRGTVDRTKEEASDE
jgi:mannose-6-phosphate isomerase-like protein (cupin superfamily)